MIKMPIAKITRRSDYTFQYNHKLGRHGWLRLTPAYSVKLVSELLESASTQSIILDPFSGTATTGLVACERGIEADLVDINPFLIWFGTAKCQNYSRSQIEEIKSRCDRLLKNLIDLVETENWVPQLYNIQRWWSEPTLKILSALREGLVLEFGEPGIRNSYNLPWVAFCRLLIETSSAKFDHVSMSFSDSVGSFEIRQIQTLFIEILNSIADTAGDRITGDVTIHSGDSRNLGNINKLQKYTDVITSPPYPNRISYIRELRPYMYWLKFLKVAHEAADLDWDAIGGTWGSATSRLGSWTPSERELPDRLYEIVGAIAALDRKNSHLMAQYVMRYFHDMHLHFKNLRDCLYSGARLYYIVGNSSFYGIQVPAQEIFKLSLHCLGYTNLSSHILRKRNSKKELFEFCVSARWNA